MMNVLYGSKVLGVKPCPYCGSTKSFLSNPFVNRELINANQFVSLFIFCDECNARGPVAKISVGREEDDFVVNLSNAKRDAIDNWNSVRRE